MAFYHYMSKVRIDKHQTQDLMDVCFGDSDTAPRIRTFLLNVDKFAVIQIDSDNEITATDFLDKFEKISPILYYSALFGLGYCDEQVLEIARMAYYTTGGLPDDPKRAKYISMLQIAIDETIAKINQERAGKS